MPPTAISLVVPIAVLSAITVSSINCKAVKAEPSTWTANVPALVTACEGTEASETGTADALN